MIPSMATAARCLQRSRPYDVTAHSLPLQMGVNVVTIDRPFEADRVKVDASISPT